MLDDYVAVVTGASSGIGAALARHLVGRGARVVVAARRIERLERLCAELGDHAYAVATDLRDPESSRRLIAAAVDRFGHLDAVVANAGIGMYGGILDHSDEDIAEMLDTNIAGTIWPIRATVPYLKAQGHGDILIVSSVAGLDARGNEAIYAATKHAQIGLAKGLDRELHGLGIRVSAICPGGVVTEFAMAPGAGRTAETPELTDMLTADEVATVIVQVVEQPRSVRTLIYKLRGATEPD